MFLLVLIFLLLLVVTVVHAAVPPYPRDATRGQSPFESVHEMRKRANIDFKYKTKFMDEENCRFLNETECAEIDERMGTHIQAHKKLYRLDDGIANAIINNAVQVRRNPNKGTINVRYILFVVFVCVSTKRF